MAVICVTVLRIFIRIPAGDVAVSPLHSTDWQAALFLYFSSRAGNSTVQIRAHPPTQCFCNIKQIITIVSELTRVSLYLPGWAWEIWVGYCCIEIQPNMQTMMSWQTWYLYNREKRWLCRNADYVNMHWEFAANDGDAHQHLGGLHAAGAGHENVVLEKALKQLDSWFLAVVLCVVQWYTPRCMSYLCSALSCLKNLTLKNFFIYRFKGQEKTPRQEKKMHPPRNWKWKKDDFFLLLP